MATIPFRARFPLIVGGGRCADNRDPWDRVEITTEVEIRKSVFHVNDAETIFSESKVSFDAFSDRLELEKLHFDTPFSVEVGILNR